MAQTVAMAIGMLVGSMIGTVIGMFLLEWWRRRKTKQDGMKVEITINSNQHPGQIARGVRDELLKLRDARKGAA